VLITQSYTLHRGLYREVVHTLCREISATPIGLDDDRARIALCYPRPWSPECSKRIEEAKSLGVSSILSFGDVVLAKGLSVVGKGHAAVVVLALRGGIVVALKVRRMDSKRDSLEGECRLLEMASRLGVAPRPYACTRNFILREFVDGPTLRRFMKTCLQSGDRDSLRRVFAKMLRAARLLDEAGIELDEITNPLDQVVVECWDPERPRFIDFESGKLSKRPTNFCKLLGFVVGKSFEGVRVAELLGIEECVNDLRALARRYKESRSPDAVRKCVDMVLQGCG